MWNLKITTDYCVCESRSVVSDSLWPHGLYSPWNSPGQNTRVGSHSLLQGIFPTQALNPDLPHCRQILYQLSHQGSPRIPEWVAYPFCSGSFWPRNQTRVSCIAGAFFTSELPRKPLSLLTPLVISSGLRFKYPWYNDKCLIYLLHSPTNIQTCIS